MLRSLVLILLIVNALFFGWSRGWLNTVVGVRPDRQHEPQRLNQQLHPEQLLILPPGKTRPVAASEPSSAASAAEDSASSASGVEAAAPAGSASGNNASTAAATASAPPQPTVCLEAGPFDDAGMTAVNTALSGILPRYKWRTNTVDIKGLWMVYMGPFPDSDTYDRKKAEIRKFKGVSFEEVRTPSNLNPGFSLGRYTRQSDAEAALDNLKERGMRSARLITVRQGGEMNFVRVSEATSDLKERLEKAKLPDKKSFGKCAQR